MASKESQLDCNVTVYFVVPDKYESEEECSDDMWNAYNKCCDYDLKPQWITCQESTSMQPQKSDVFVIEEFTGKVFEKLTAYKCSIVGPRCLLICFNNGEPIPEGTSPVYTTAMRNVCVCVSGLSADEKENIHKLVEYMGGFYTKPLRSCVTHLVTDSVMSAKYESAVGMKIPIVTKEWVEAIWETNLKQFVRANDKMFDKYKCPVFMHLVVTSTSLPKRQKEDIKHLINEHGGTFMGPLDGAKVRIVVAPENSPLSDKLKYAMQNNIACLKPDWVFDSVKLGYALPFDKFLIKSTKACSTPEKNRVPENLSFNFSAVSGIPNEEQRNYMDESAGTIMGDLTATDRLSTVVSHSPQTAVLDRLTLSDAKMAGPFLDGCNIYLAGFAANQRDKLNRILNVGSATRFDEISDALTHVLVGDENKASNELKVIRSKGLGPYILTLDWLEESMKLKRPAAEDLFLHGEKNNAAKVLPTEPPSPLSKKNLQMLQRPRRPTIPSFDIDKKIAPAPVTTEKDADDLVQQYLKKPDVNCSVTEFLSKTVQERLKSQDDVAQMAADKKRRQESFSKLMTDIVPAPTDTSNSNAEDDSAVSLSPGSTVQKIFQGLTFAVTGSIDEENYVTESITSLGGKIVSQLFSGVPDYGVVPVLGSPLKLTVNEIVTNLYIEDCINEGKILDIAYYHRPLSVIKGLNPLSKCVITISIYSGVERTFLGVMATELGAMFQDTFARKTNVEKNTYASTHLICPTPEGNKYNAAVKWNLPAVTAEWLKACATQSKRVDETPYLVGETMAPERTPANDASQGNPQKLNESQTALPRSERTIITPKRHLPLVQNENSSSTGQTPFINKRLSAVMNNTPPSPFHVATPDTPYGQIFKSNPSPDTRKGWRKWVDHFPDLHVNEPPAKRRRPSTPLSELKRQLWQKLKDGTNVEQETSIDLEPAEANKIQEQVQSKETNKQPDKETVTPPINRKLTFADENSPFRNNQINLQLAQLEQALQRSSSTPESRHSSGEMPRKYDTQESVIDIQKCLVKDSQPDTVGWEDPSHRLPFRPSTVHEEPNEGTNEEESVRLPEDDQEDANYTETDNELLQKSESLPKSKPKPKFMLSGVRDKATYEQVIRELGGDVSIEPQFDGAATHLLCTRPSRNEKMLGSIASGKWVLHCSYLRDSEQEGKFVDEERYEWGNPKSKDVIPEPRGETEQAIAAAAYRWRLSLSNDPRGPFHDMVALLLVSEDKFEQFKRLIEAGGGSVQQVRPPYDASPSGKKITHCFVNVKQVNQPIDWAMLASKGILCFLPQYLSDHLTASKPLNPRELVLPEFRKYLTLLPR